MEEEASPVQDAQPRLFSQAGAASRWHASAHEEPNEERLRLERELAAKRLVETRKKARPLRAEAKQAAPWFQW